MIRIDKETNVRGESFWLVVDGSEHFYGRRKEMPEDLSLKVEAVQAAARSLNLLLSAAYDGDSTRIHDDVLFQIRETVDGLGATLAPSKPKTTSRSKK